MTKIYVISGRSGEYDAYTQWDVVAVRSEERAKTLVDKLNRIVEFNEEIKERVRTEFSAQYDTENPFVRDNRVLPAVSDEFRRAIDICATGKGTHEDKARLRGLQTDHLRRRNEYYEANSASNKLLAAALKVKNEAEEKWREKNCHLPEDLKEVADLDNYKYNYHSYGTEYIYSELELMDE